MPSLSTPMGLQQTKTNCSNVMLDVVWHNSYMAALSMDLREAIVPAYGRGEGTRAQIAARYDVSLGMAKKLLQRWRTAT